LLLNSFALIEEVYDPPTNRAQDRLKLDEEDYIAQGEKEAALDILVYIDQVERGNL